MSKKSTRRSPRAGRPCGLPLLLALLGAPCATAQTAQCTATAAEFLAQGEANAPGSFTTAGCSADTPNTICRTEGVPGPCADVPVCEPADTTINESCEDAAADPPCCVVGYANICLSTCTETALSACVQYCQPLASATPTIPVAVVTPPPPPTPPFIATPTSPATPQSAPGTRNLEAAYDIPPSDPECQAEAATVLRGLSAASSPDDNVRISTAGCAAADEGDICAASGKRGSCASVRACLADFIVESETCMGGSDEVTCCLEVYRKVCDGEGGSCGVGESTGVCQERCVVAGAGDDDDDSSALAVGLGVMGGVLVAILAGVAACVYCCCCRNKDKPAAQEGGKPVVNGGQHAQQAQHAQPAPYLSPQPQPAAPLPYAHPQPQPAAPLPYAHPQPQYGPPGPVPAQQATPFHTPPPQPFYAAPQAAQSANGCTPMPYPYAAPPPPPPPPQPGRPPLPPTATNTNSYAASHVSTANARSTASATESSAQPQTATNESMTPSVPHSTPPVNPYTAQGTAKASTFGSTTYGQTTFGATMLAPWPPPGAGAPVRERMEYVHFQLDTLAGREVLNGLVLEPGMSNRMQGGQAVIQFAKDRRNGLLYALKFFLSTTAFNDEAALYTDRGSPLGFFLPQLRTIAGAAGHEAAVADGHGQPLPPCIVMEKGESLDVWMKRNRDGVDMVTGLQVIQHVAERLSDLHGAGYVHRDLKQSNIMWLPRENRWTLIDFGCAARLGEDAPLSFSLYYAPPEVIHAVRAGRRTIVAETSMDAWTLGIVAVELFTNRPCFNQMEGREQVMAKIVGEHRLPWEDGAEGSQAVLRKLGRFRPGILGLLQRDPQQRLSISAFVGRCRSVLEQTAVG